MTEVMPSIFPHYDLHKLYWQPHLLAHLVDETYFTHNGPHANRSGTYSPRFDLRESDSAYFLDGELPDVASVSDIEMTWKGAHTLCIEAKILKVDLGREWGVDSTTTTATTAVPVVKRTQEAAANGDTNGHLTHDNGNGHSYGPDTDELSMNRLQRVDCPFNHDDDEPVKNDPAQREKALDDEEIVTPATQREQVHEAHWRKDSHEHQVDEQAHFAAHWRKPSWDKRAGNTKDAAKAVNGNGATNEKNQVKEWASERHCGFFRRVFTFPDDCDAAGLEARLQQGLLKVMVPKAAVVPVSREKIVIKG